jgi:N-acetylmuramoyl-L-alanine amidase
MTYLRLGVIFLAAIVAALGLIAAFLRWPPFSQREPPLVAIDIGHSLAQPGATSARGAKEFDFNRRLALTIQNALVRMPLRTMMVGLDGRAEVLTDRTRTAERAQLFLSVHHDSVLPQFLTRWEFEGAKLWRSEGFRGYSLFVSRSNPFLAESLACASAIGRHLRDAGFKASEYHAQEIPGEGKPFADKENGVHYFDGLAVLRTARSPAVLLEAGVITDPDEEAQLLRSDVQEAIAAAIARGLGRCLLDSRGESKLP